MSCWIRLRDACLLLFRLLPMISPLRRWVFLVARGRDSRMRGGSLRRACVLDRLSVMIVVSSSALLTWVVGKGVLLRVRRLCMYVVVWTTLGDVRSVEVLAVWPTLGGAPVSTLGSGAFSRILVSRWMILACVHLYWTEAGTEFFRAFITSAAASSVLSSSEIVGTLQCVGYNL